MTGHITAPSDKPSMVDLQDWAITTGIRDPLLWPDGDPDNRGFRKATYTRLLKAYRAVHPVAVEEPEVPGRGPGVTISNTRQRERQVKDASGTVRPVEEVSLPQWTTGASD
jgi:hypothetical protein